MVIAQTADFSDGIVAVADMDADCQWLMPPSSYMMVQWERKLPVIGSRRSERRDVMVAMSWLLLAAAPG